MKLTKKLSACVLALMLIVCSVAFSVSAAEDGREKDVGTDATIAIYPSEDGSVSLENKTFNLYRIFDASVSAGTGTATQANVSYTWNIPSGQTKSPYYDFFFTDWSGSGTVLVDSAGVTDSSSVSKAVDYIAGFNNNANEMSKLADSLKDYSVAKNITPDATTPSTVSASKIQYNDLKYGYYLIVETTADLGTSGVRSAPILTTAAPDATIYLKATKPSIDKNIVGLNATGKYFDNARANDGFFTPAKGISASAGDVVTYAITFKVPDRSDYRLGYTFSIKDLLPESLELVRGSLAVYESGNLIEGNTTDNKTDNPDANYWIAADGSLEFNFDKKKADDSLVYPVGNTVTILYEATLKDNAQSVNVNTATLTYSSDPTDASKTSSITSSAKVYTYQLVFGKYAANTDGSLTGVFLTGAQFELYNVTPDGEIGEIVKFKESTTENGAYTVSTAAEGTVTTLEVLEADNEGVGSDPNNIDGGKQGQFKILGLGSGNYALREIKAPDGYALPHNDFKFVIQDTFGAIEGDQITLTLTFTNPDGDNKVKPVCTTANPSTQKMYVRVPNLPGSTLPSTGGMGTFLFIGIGVVFMGACILYFVIRHKRKNSAAK